jgi:hypothetical protein
MVELTHAGPPQARPSTALSENIPRQANGDLHNWRF